MQIITATKKISVSNRDEKLVRDILKDRPWAKNLLDIFIQRAGKRTPVTTSMSARGVVFEGGNICMVNLEPLNNLTKLIGGYEVNPELLDKLIVGDGYNPEILLQIAKQIAAAPIGNRPASLLPYTKVEKKGESKFVHCRILKPAGISTEQLLAGFVPGHVMATEKEIKLFPIQQGNSPADANPNIPALPDRALLDINAEGVIDIKYHVLELRITMATTLDALENAKQEAEVRRQTEEAEAVKEDEEFQKKWAAREAEKAREAAAASKKKLDALESAQSSSSSYSASSSAVFKSSPSKQSSEVYEIKIHSDYSVYLKDYLHSLNGKPTNDSRLTDSNLRAAVEEKVKDNCSPISLSVPNIPVILGETPFSLEEIEALFVGDSRTAVDPVSKRDFTRQDIGSATKLQDQIDKFIRECEQEKLKLNK